MSRVFVGFARNRRLQMLSSGHNQLGSAPSHTQLLAACGRRSLPRTSP